jgi:hypothetical protein
MEESNWEKIADSYKREAYSLNKENKALKEKIERYEKALKFYADDDNWGIYDGVPYMEGGGSWEAKEALGI